MPARKAESVAVDLARMGRLRVRGLPWAKIAGQLGVDPLGVVIAQR